MVWIAPSILSADFAALAGEVEALRGEAEWIHVDVMDGHFVPNLTIGPPVVAALRRHDPRIVLDCHLMMTNPDAHLEAFAQAGADRCSVHVEIGRTGELISQMRDLELGVGVALSPETELSTVLPFLDQIDLLLVMTVHPGFGGQEFIADVMQKVRAAREIIDATGREIPIQVDGGIDDGTVLEAARAGASVFVAGTAVFGNPDPAAAVRALRAAALAARP